MPYQAPSRDAAERAAAALRAAHVGKPADIGRTCTNFIVSKYADPNGPEKDDKGRFAWGVVMRWVYDDRPDLGEFGGAFWNLTPDLYA